jgi:hypothetical protein
VEIAGIIVWMLHERFHKSACRTPWPSSAAPFCADYHHGGALVGWRSLVWPVLPWG